MLSRRPAPKLRRSNLPSRFLIEALEQRRLLSVNVLTYHDDTTNSGANTNELSLTPANVKVGSFGKLFATTVDGQVYAQPLVDNGVTITSGTNTIAGETGVHNVVFVATENDSLYAIDSGTGVVLWKRSFITTSESNGDLNNTLNATSITTVAAADVGTQDINPTIGITSTPVIDSARNLIYVVAATKEVIGGTTYFVQRLHAISLSNGTDATTPFLIGQTSGTNTNNTPIYVYGNGDGHVTDPYNNTGKAVVQFNALTENQRSALSLVNNTVYVAFASHGDNGPYHGWVVAWSVANVTTSGFVMSGVLNTCPNDGESGVWSAGGGLVWEPDGSAFYFMTGNGTGEAPTDGANDLPTDADYNEALIKAVADPTTTPTNQNPNGWGLKIVSSFTPYNVAALDGADSDFGSGAPLLIPTPVDINGVEENVIIAGGKDGRIFVLNRNDLGGYHATDDAAFNSVPNGNGDETPPVADAGTLSSPAYYDGNIYIVSGYSGDAYEFDISSTGALSTVSQSTINFGYEPGSPSVSSDGSSNGIVWIPDRNTNELHAYSASSLNDELWNSARAPGGADNPGALEKFANPTVANGEVLLGTTDQLVAYGLTPAASTVSKPPVLSASPLSGTAVNLTWTDSSVLPNVATAYLIYESTDDVNFTQVTTAPAGATSIGIGGLNPSTKYYFEIQGYNAIGDSGYSNVVTVTTTSQSAGVNFASGFAGAASTMTINGNAAINGSNLELTNGNDSEAGSAFTNALVNVTSFTSQFTFQISAGANTADGFTFTMQNVAPTAIGNNAGSLGYATINNSVAIKFDLYSNNGEGPDSTGLFSGGAIPTNNGSIDLSSTGINLHSGDPIQASLTYNGTTLTVVLTDTVTGGTATQNYTVNIPTLIGSDTAYVGFTGATGGLPATQNIQSWTYTPGAGSSPNAPTGLGATPASATSVTLNWTNNALNATGYHLDRATDSGFTQNLITETLPSGSTTYTDTAAGLATGDTFYYRIRAFNSVADSGNSNTASVTIPASPAKASNQQITGVSTNEIDMSWQDNAGHSALGYHILRAANQGTFTLVATLPPTSRTAPSTYTWADTTVTPGTYYEYHIEAYNTSGYNDFAGVNATTISLAPTGIAASQTSSGTTISWSAVTAFGGATYNIYRSTTPGGEGTTPLYTGITATSYLDTSAPTGTTYYYTITAVNQNVSYTPPLPSESAQSAEVSTAGIVSSQPGQLTGTASANTTSSYDGKTTDNFTTVFDGNTNTFFDAPTANGNWVQLNFAAPQTITSIAYAPRVGFEYRMVGGVFEASNDPTFSTGVVTLYTVNSTPADGLTTQPVSVSGTYQYVRYVSPANSYGNIAEMQVFGPGSSGGSTPTVTTAPAAAFSANGITAALTVSASEAGNPALTYTWSTATLPDGVSAPPTFSAANGTTSGSSVTASFLAAGTYGLDVTITDPSKNSIVVPLSVTVGQVLTSITVHPSTVPVSVPAGGTVDFTAVGNDQFDDDMDTQPTFTWSVVSGGTGTINATTGVYTATGAVGSTATVTATAQGTAGTVVGSQPVKTIAGTGGGTTTPTQLTGTASANTTSSYDGKTTDNFATVFDGNTNTFFDAPTANGNWVQLAFSSPQTITQIAYAPRVGFEYRMVGGIFEASNDPTFSTGVVTLYTVNSTPVDGLTTQAVSVSGTYQYVRYVSPTNSYGNIAEMQVFGTGGSSGTTVAPPSALKATGGTAQVSLSWTASTTAGVTYDIYRGTAAGGENATPIVTGVTGVTYTDSGLGAGTYYYTVAAVNSASVISAVSNEANAPVTAATTTIGQLTGTASANTTSSYDGKTTDNFTAVFDGNTNTFFDAPTASGNWVQLNLGSPQTITQIAYAPRQYFESRMVGGVFEASNDPTFTTGVVTLYTVNSTPADGLTTQAVSPGAAYQYVRYVSPANSYGNIAEMQVFGTASSTPTAAQLTGTSSANTTSSYDGKTTDNFATVFDGNTNTFFDAPTANGNWVQLNLGSPQTITQIAYAPRVGFEYRMVGGVFEASNDPTFSTGVVTLYTVNSTPADGLTTQAVSPGAAYQYVRYVSPANSYGNIAEMQVFGTASSTPTAAQLTGTSSANTTSSYDGKSTDNFATVFDGNTNTFFDAPTANGNWVQLNLGSPRTITKIAYAPRVGFEYRMVGGVFEASNDPTFSTGVVTLYTVNSTPVDGLTTQAISVGGTYQYVRYVSPAGSYGNIAELQLFGY